MESPPDRTWSKPECPGTSRGRVRCRRRYGVGGDRRSARQLPRSSTELGRLGVPGSLQPGMGHERRQEVRNRSSSESVYGSEFGDID